MPVAVPVVLTGWNWSGIRTYAHVALIWFGLGVLAHDRVVRWAGVGGQDSDVRVVAGLTEISGKLDTFAAAEQSSDSKLVAGVAAIIAKLDGFKPGPSPIPPGPTPPGPGPPGPKPNPNPPWIPPGPKPDPPAPTPVAGQPLPRAPLVDETGNTIQSNVTEWRAVPSNQHAIGELEWRVLDWAPHWKVLGRMVDGQFLFKDWRPVNGNAR